MNFSVSLLVSGYLLLSFWSGDLIYFFMLLDDMDFCHRIITWLQFPPATTRWGSGTVYSGPSMIRGSPAPAADFFSFCAMFWLMADLENQTGGGVLSFTCASPASAFLSMQSSEWSQGWIAGWWKWHFLTPAHFSQTPPLFPHSTLGDLRDLSTPFPDAASLSIWHSGQQRAGVPGRGRASYVFCVIAVLSLGPHQLHPLGASLMETPLKQLSVLYVWGFPLGCQGTQREMVFMQRTIPPPFSLRALHCPEVTGCCWEEKSPTYQLPLPPEDPAPLPSDTWLHGSLRRLLCCVNVLSWCMNVFFDCTVEERVQEETSLCYYADITM